MDMTPVESSNVESVGYDPGTAEMHVRFKDGGLYRYEGVHQETYDELMAAESVGTYLHQTVKGQHAHERLE